MEITQNKQPTKDIKNTKFQLPIPKNTIGIKVER
jgi:hypothetical protein